jgi:hypothetical protein
MNPPRWVGWVWCRETRQWLSVCDHSDVSECHRELLRYVDAFSIACKWTALTGGNRPGWSLEGME